MAEDAQDSQLLSNEELEKIELPNIIFIDVLKTISGLFEPNTRISTKALFKDGSTALQIDKKYFEQVFRTFLDESPKQQAAVFAKAGLAIRQIDKGWWEITDFDGEAENAAKDSKDSAEELQALSEAEKTLLDLIPPDGSTIGNYTLIDRFQEAIKAKTGEAPPEEEYWKARNRLIAEGVINKGRGKGGSVYRSSEALDTQDQHQSSTGTATEDAEEGQVGRDSAERRLYEPFKKYLDFWANDNGLENRIIHQTSDGGGKKTGGKWTRPDFVVFSRRVFEFVHGAFFELITFEIKPQGGDRIESVFETAAHARFSNRSFLAIHQPAGRPDTAEFRRIEDECRRLGLGLIIFRSPESVESYEILVDAEHRIPDPEHMDQFIKAQMEKVHSNIRQMLR